MTEADAPPLPPLHELWPPEHLAARAQAMADMALILRNAGLAGLKLETPDDWLKYSFTFTAAAEHLRAAIPPAPDFPPREPVNAWHVHDLKIWPAFYELVEMGIKTFEVRRHDRDYRPNDVIILREWNPDTHKYTGRVARYRISFLLEGGRFGLGVGWCAFAIFPDLMQAPLKTEPAPKRSLKERLRG